MRSPKSTWRENARTAITFALIYVLVWGGIPVPALAQMGEEAIVAATEGSEGEQGQPDLGIESADEQVGESGGEGSESSGEEVLSVEADVEVSDQLEDTDNEELLEGYVQRMLDESLDDGSNATPTLRKSSAGSGLSSPNAAAYEALKAMAKAVAASTQTSAVAEVKASALYGDFGWWSAADLGIDALFDDEGRLMSVVTTAALRKMGIDLNAILGALVADLPYDLYWYERSGGRIRVMVSTIYTQKDANPPTINLKDAKLTFSLDVAKEYSASGEGGTSEVREGILQTVQNAINTAKGIVASNKDKSTTDKLVAYRTAICNAVSYDNDAAASVANGGSYTTSNPWQLVWVFDGNNNTNVVCEGYSKAFKYLCDLTWPDSDESNIECLIVSGTMDGGTGAGLHMWNVMRMDDGSSYLVDVTNCDEGTVGVPDKLFMAYGPVEGGSVASGYTFVANGRSVEYAYDKATKGYYSSDVLTISGAEYTGPTPAQPTEIDVPTAANGLVYSGSKQTGVAAGTGYTLSGVAAATDAGTYTATATLSDGYVWSDGATDPVDIPWSIARKPVTVTADDKTKAIGVADPELTVTVTGTVGDDTVNFTLSRAEGEDVGDYAITLIGDAEQGNYAVTYVPGTLTIEPAAAVLHSGTWGTCPWEITSDGLLVVHPGEGASQPDNCSSAWADQRYDITSVAFVASSDRRVVLPEQCNNLFDGLSRTTTMNLSGCDTSSVTDMSCMFSGCSSLASISLSGWDVSSVTNMQSMFAGCGLTSLDLMGWDVSSVTNISGLFYWCDSLVSVGGLSGWDVSAVTDMSGLFYACSKLTSVGDLSGWKTSSVTNMGSMFEGCLSLASVGDLSGWNVSLVTDMGLMFNGCSELTSLNLSGWDTSFVEDMSSMFEGCSSLAVLNLSSWETTSVGDYVHSMLLGCSSLERLTVGKGFMFKRYMLRDVFDNYDPIASTRFWSAADHCWYLGSEIFADGAAGRSGVADTYTRLPEAGYETPIADTVVLIGGTSSYSCTYNGGPMTPGVSVTDADGRQLVEGTDYTLTYSDNVNAGTAKVTVRGMRAYAGSRDVAFTISPADIGAASVSVVPAQVYTGQALRPGLTVKAGGKALAPSVDYAVSYSNNVGPGTASAVVAGRGNYAGRVSVTFRIEARGIWVRQGSSWYWYGADGRPAKGWARISGSWYYLDQSSGALRSGWLKDGGKWYYLNPANDSRMATGWVKVGGYWYLFASGGQMLSGWQKSGGKWYYLNSANDSRMATGWLKVGGYWYLFASGGQMLSGWQKSGGKWYYLDPANDSRMATGWRQIGGKWYWFDPSGVMATGRRQIGGKWYTFDSNGAWVG